MTIMPKLFTLDFRKRNGAKHLKSMKIWNLDLNEKGNLIGTEILIPGDYPIDRILKPSV